MSFLIGLGVTFTSHGRIRSPYLGVVLGQILFGLTPIVSCPAFGALCDAEPNLANLILAPYFTDVIRKSQSNWRLAVAEASKSGIAIPAFSSALAYYDSYRSANLPANSRYPISPRLLRKSFAPHWLKMPRSASRSIKYARCYVRGLASEGAVQARG